MSEARWCDPGKHAYPQTDPLAQTFTIDKQVKNQWGGYQPTKITQEACGACSIDLGLAGLGKPDIGDHEKEAREIRGRAGGLALDLGKPKAIESDGSVRDPEEAKRRGYDPDYVKWLEEQQEKEIPAA